MRVILNRIILLLLLFKGEMNKRIAKICIIYIYIFILYERSKVISCYVVDVVTMVTWRFYI